MVTANTAQSLQTHTKGAYKREIFNKCAFKQESFNKYVLRATMKEDYFKLLCSGLCVNTIRYDSQDQHLLKHIKYVSTEMCVMCLTGTD